MPLMPKKHTPPLPDRDVDGVGVSWVPRDPDYGFGTEEELGFCTSQDLWRHRFVYRASSGRLG